MSVKEQQTGAWAPEWVQETEPEYTPRPRRSRKQRRPRWPGIALALVCLATIAALVWHFTRQKEIPLETAAGYVASEAETAPLYDEEGNVLRQLVRGSQVTYVVEEAHKDRPDQVRVPQEDGSFAWLDRENLTDDLSSVVTLKTVYVRRAQNLTDEGGDPTGPLVLRGQALTVTGYRDLAADGSVSYYRADGGYIPARYVRLTEEEAAAAYDADMAQLHADRGDSYGGGDAAGLDYDAYEKPKFENNVMPGTVKALYLNNEAIRNPEAYIAVADGCGINAFVVDIMDGGAIGYASPVMQKYSPSAYADAYNTLESYQAAVKKLKDAGYYVIGRITAFNDPNLAADHPECVVADLSGRPLKIGGMYWPSVYSRQVWQYKVELALEAAETMGFNEIQFDYVRFPDGTWDYDEAGTIDYHNDNDESKAQAVQRFLQYAADRLHGAGVYVSADVFGECAEKYVTAYGQYWAAISGVVDAISAMPYPDHYSASGSWLPWEHPYETMKTFGEKAAARQQNVADKEVLKIQHGAARAQGLDAAPHVVAQRAGQAQHDQRRRAHQASPAAVPAEVFPRTGDDILKHRNDRGEAGERHEQEEQRAPQASARHVCKDVGQRDENQARSRVGRDAEGEAGREDDKARADRHKGVQHADAGGLARQGEAAVHVAAENLNCADAEA